MIVFVSLKNKDAFSLIIKEKYFLTLCTYTCTSSLVPSDLPLSSLRVPGSVSAGRFHHHGGPEVAALLPHLHLGLPLLLDALRYDLVAHGLRSRRPGAP